nr:MarR family transcriptional regulator [Kineosporia rhizophila]
MNDPGDPPESPLEDALMRTTFQVAGVLSAVGAEHNLSLTQIRVLGILRDRRVRVTELADYMGLDKSTMSGLVERAERRGLLARRKNPEDRRGVDVVITEAGLELAAVMYARVRELLGPAFARLDQPQSEQLAALLEVFLTPPTPNA